MGGPCGGEGGGCEDLGGGLAVPLVDAMAVTAGWHSLPADFVIIGR